MAEISTDRSFKSIRGGAGSMAENRQLNRAVDSLRQFEDALHRSEQRYALAARAGQTGVWEAWLDTDQIEADEILWQMLGRDRPSRPRSLQDWLKLIHPEDLPGARRILAETARGRAGGFKIEVRMRHADGQWRWILAQGSPAGDELGHRVLGTITDITPLKRTEQYARDLLSAIPDLIVRLDLQGRVLQWRTDGAGPLAERARGQAIERLLPDASAERVRGLIARVIDTGRVEPIELELPCSDGPRQFEGRILSGGDEVVMILRDMTDQLLAEQKLEKARRLESVGLLAGGIAHDFNNLLMAILGNISLASLSGPLDAETRELLNDARAAAERARDLTGQLLTFARGGAPVRTAASLGPVVKETVAFCVRGSKVRAELDVAEGLWPAHVDVGQISQVVNNLVLNAVQAMPDGGTIRVSLANETLPAESLALPGGRYLKLTIRDQGPGIAPAEAERIFDPYFTTKPGGTGLGLATCHSIVARHGGSIWIDSAGGAGATFCVLLPAAEAPAESTGHPPPQPDPGRGRILVMDDDDSVRTVVVKMLQVHGYQVEAAADGAEAVQLYRRARQDQAAFDAVVLDLTVPGGMGGLDALTELRKVDPYVRAIISSGYSHDPVMGNYRRHGFVGVVVKPYHPDDLARAVGRVVDRA